MNRRLRNWWHGIPPPLNPEDLEPHEPKLLRFVVPILILVATAFATAVVIVSFHD